MFYTKVKTSCPPSPPARAPLFPFAPKKGEGDLYLLSTFVKSTPYRSVSLARLLSSYPSGRIPFFYIYPHVSLPLSAHPPTPPPLTERRERKKSITSPLPQITKRILHIPSMSRPQQLLPRNLIHTVVFRPPGQRAASVIEYTEHSGQSSAVSKDRWHRAD